MNAATVGGHTIHVPSRQEAEELTDCCQNINCMSHVQPAAVLYDTRRRQVTGRYAAYRCPGCGTAWLCWWAAPKPPRGHSAGGGPC